MIKDAKTVYSIEYRVYSEENKGEKEIQEKNSVNWLGKKLQLNRQARCLSYGGGAGLINQSLTSTPHLYPV